MCGSDRDLPTVARTICPKANGAQPTFQPPIPLSRNSSRKTVVSNRSERGSIAMSRWFILMLPFILTLSFSQSTASATDANVVLRVSLVGEQNQFHIGEKIPLELGYSSAVKDWYQLNMAQYDRSGRM